MITKFDHAKIVTNSQIYYKPAGLQYGITTRYDPEKISKGDMLPIYMYLDRFSEPFNLLSIFPRFETESDEVPLMSLALASETSLKKDWLKPEEDDAWADL